MSFDGNITMLVGRLTRDPELTYTKSNIPICKFSIANNRGKNDEVNFFNITAWDKIATTCSQYLKKGSQVLIIGKLRQDRWADSEGKNKSKVEVTANTVQFLGGKKDNDQNTTTGQTGQSVQTGQPPGPAPSQQDGGNNRIDFESFDSEPMGNDEVPF